MLKNGECAYSQAEKHLSAYCFPTKVVEDIIMIDKRVKIKEVSDGSESDSLKNAIQAMIKCRPELFAFELRTYDFTSVAE